MMGLPPKIRGSTVIGRGSTIGPDTTVVDCEIGENVTVKRTDATLAVIGDRASVGPFAYLRPGTYLGADGKTWQTGYDLTYIRK